MLTGWKTRPPLPHSGQRRRWLRGCNKVVTKTIQQPAQQWTSPPHRKAGNQGTANSQTSYLHQVNLFSLSQRTKLLTKSQPKGKKQKQDKHNLCHKSETERPVHVASKQKNAPEQSHWMRDGERGEGVAGEREGERRGERAGEQTRIKK